MDRITPTLRPDATAVMRPSWLDLTFVHWRVPVSVLRPLVPPALTIDTFDGDAFVGLVPFTMRNVRPRWAPPLGAITDFHETNVRTYVHLDGEHPGVWFFSLDAASRLAVLAARLLWHLPYHHARMELARIGDGPHATVHYRSERLRPGPLPARCELRCRPTGRAEPARAGTLEHFLVERYLLYAVQRNGRLWRGAVHHRPYPLQPAEVELVDTSLVTAAGETPPTSTPFAQYASRVDVEVFALRPVA